jgi:SAM-dependent methyltransferase
MSAFADSQAYESFMGRWSRVLGDAFVRFAGVEEGERVLDLGCGTGSLTAAILSARSTVDVVGLDPSPAFVDAARDRFPDARVRFETGDAQHLPFADATFDRVVSMLVLNFVPDPGAAASEIRRVTRKGGHAAACVWDYGGGMQMLRFFWDAATALDPAAAGRHEERMRLCRHGELEALWRGAGFEGVQETAITIEMRFKSFADYWQPFLGGVGPAGSFVASLTSDQQQALEARLRTGAWDDRPDEARVLPARAWAVVGTVPRGS